MVIGSFWRLLTFYFIIIFMQWLRFKNSKAVYEPMLPISSTLAGNQINGNMQYGLVSSKCRGNGQHVFVYNSRFLRTYRFHQNKRWIDIILVISPEFLIGPITILLKQEKLLYRKVLEALESLIGSITIFRKKCYIGKY